MNSPSSSWVSSSIGPWKSRWEYGRVLQQLAVAVAVAVGRLDLARRVEAEPELLQARVGLEAVGRPARDDDVVALPEEHGPEVRAQLAGAAVDVDDLVALAVAVKALLGLGRLGDGDLDVVVVHQQLAPGDGVAARGRAVDVGEAVDVGVGDPLLAADRGEAADLRQPARRVQVVEDRLVAAEALVAEDLLGQQRRAAPSRRTCDVALGGDLTEAQIAHASHRTPTGCPGDPARAPAPRRAP